MKQLQQAKEVTHFKICTGSKHEMKWLLSAAFIKMIYNLSGIRLEETFR